MNNRSKITNYTCWEFLHWNIYFAENQKQEIKSVFEDEGGFPGIIRLIEGTHFRIRAPEHEPEAYVNRKKFHSFNVEVDGVAKKKLNKKWPVPLHH